MPPPWAAGYAEYRAAITRGKVQAPGVILQLGGALLCLGVAGFIAAAAAAWADPNARDREIVAIFCAIGAAACLVTGPLIFLGGARMRSFRSYGLALTSVILIFGLGLLICLPLALVGVWPLIVLLDNDVRMQFQQRAYAPQQF